MEPVGWRMKPGWVAREAQDLVNNSQTGWEIRRIHKAFDSRLTLLYEYHKNVFYCGYKQF